MATPISNNNPALTDHRRAGNSNNENAGGIKNSAVAGEETAVQRQDDAVNVSNAAQALGSSATSQGEGNLQNSNQAAELAQKIASFFAENGAGALAAHGNSSNSLADLLKAG